MNNRALIPQGVTELRRNRLLIFAFHDVFPGTISSVIRWCRPRDDGDAVMSGYQVFVDGSRHGNPLSHSALETQVKVRILLHFPLATSLFPLYFEPKRERKPAQSGLCVEVCTSNFKIRSVLSLHLSITSLFLQLPVAYHVIEVQTLTDHPIGPSPLSNPVELSGREFLPFVLFCYFDLHKRGERLVKRHVHTFL